MFFFFGSRTEIVVKIIHVVVVLTIVVLAFTIIKLHFLWKFECFFFLRLRVGDVHFFTANCLTLVFGGLFIICFFFFLFLSFLLLLFAIFILVTLLFLSSSLLLGLRLALSFFVLSILLLLIITTVPELFIHSTRVKVINASRLFVDIVISFVGTVVVLILLVVLAILGITFQLFLIHVDSILRIFHLIIAVLFLVLLLR